MKKVIVFVTFYIFHDGHKNFFMQAKKYGDFLRVVVARDATVLKVKKYVPKHSEKERMDIIEKSALANEVVLGSLDDKYEVVRDYKPDIICLGYDQKFFVKDLKNKLRDFRLDKADIIRLKSYYPEKYKTSLLKKKLC